MALRRSALPSQRPFDERLGPGGRAGVMDGADTYLGRRMIEAGFAAYYIPWAIVTHRIPAERVGWNYLCARARSSGFASATYRYSGNGGTAVISSLRLWSRLLRARMLAATTAVFGSSGDARRWSLEAQKVEGAIAGLAGRMKRVWKTL